MQLIPGGSLITTFTVLNATGTPTNFDAAPTVTFYHNGIADATWTSYTLTNVIAGNYVLSTTIPSGYVLADEISIYVNGLVATVAIGLVVLEAQLANTADNATVNALTTGGTYATANAIWASTQSTWVTPGTMGYGLVNMAMSVWNVLKTAAFTAGSMAQWILGLLPASTAVTLPTTPPSEYATSSNQTTILNAVNAITTNVARAKMVMPTFMARPTSGSSTYAIAVYVYNLEGHLEDPDTNTITIGAANAAGASLNAGLSSTTMTRVSAGLYTVNYTVNSTDATGEAIYTISWAVGGVAMATAMASMIEDAESLATLAAIEAKTNLIATNAGDSPNAVAAQGTISTLSSTTATAAAAAILINPSDKLKTDVNGNVTFNNAIPVPPTTTQIQAALAAGSALPANVTQILTIAPTLTGNNINTYAVNASSGGGSGNGSVTVTVTSTASGTPAVPGATCSLNNSAGQQVASGQTDSSGQVVLSADAGTYTLITTLSGQYGPASQSLTMATGTANTASVSLTPTILPPSVVPGYCQCYATLYDLDGSLYANAKVTITMTNAPTGQASGTGIFSAISVTTNDLGQIVDGTETGVGLPQGATVTIQWGSRSSSFTVDSATSMQIPPFTGR